MARFRKKISSQHARRIVDKASNKTKVRAIISLLSFAGNSQQAGQIIASVDTTRANYYDVYVKPFSKVQVLHFDIAIYQSGTSVSPDGFVDWALVKSPGGSLTFTNPNGVGLTNVPYTFRTGRAAVPMLSSSGIPNVYHLSGDIKVPPRFQTFGPGDTLYLICMATPASAGVSYSVNGTVTYMFKN